MFKMSSWFLNVSVINILVPDFLKNKFVFRSLTHSRNTRIVVSFQFPVCLFISIILTLTDTHALPAILLPPPLLDINPAIKD